MVSEDQVLKALPNVLKSTDFNFGKKFTGKVRDTYILDDGRRIIVTTDRQSAFDYVLGEIPFKGAVLNQLAAFWFEQTKDIVDNHLISVPDPNVSIVKSCEGIPIEMIVRGFISGVTNTSIWGSYQKGERVIYGIKFPDGLKKNQKLDEPVITPTTHGDPTGKGGHDERLTRDQILTSGLVDKEIYMQMEKVALELFKKGSAVALKQGLILVDTKYEFGLIDGKLTLMDEIHTPDKERFDKGQEPENFDKEFLRLWYAERGYKGDGQPPGMSEDLIVQLSQRYIAVCEKLTGKTFEAFEYPIERRIEDNIRKSI
jgi:phosphoribosylaminoimidazole-succinocarboxamide synthase